MNPTARQQLRIAIVTEFVRALPGASCNWARLIARELAARGHLVTVIADGIEDPRTFDPLPVVVHRHGRIHHGCEPFGFRRWCRRVTDSLRPDVTLSLTDHVAADVWLPLGPGAGAFLRGLRHTTLVGAAMDIAHRPYVLLELLSQSAARREARALNARRVGFAADPRSQSLPLGSLVLPTTATLGVMSADERTAARESMRRSMSLSPSTPLLMMSAGDHEIEYFDVIFEAMSQLRSHSSAAPRLLLLSRTPTRLRRRAMLWNVDDALLPAGSTQRPELLLAASDALIHPCPARRGESSGRLIADAILMQLPVLADAAAPGSSLIAPGAGIRLHAPTPARWRDAILHACDPSWRARAALAGGIGVPTLGSLIDTLESALIDAADARRERASGARADGGRSSATA